MADWTIDTDKMISILKADRPISMGAFEDGGKTKLITVFALPELEDRIKNFVNLLLKEYEPCNTCGKKPCTCYDTF